MDPVKKQKTKLMRTAKDVERTVAETEQSFRAAIAAAVDEGRELAQNLAAVPATDRIAWLQRNFPGTRKLAAALIRVAQNPPATDAPLEDLMPICIALVAEGKR
jgi:hypothetical protein